MLLALHQVCGCAELALSWQAGGRMGTPPALCTDLDAAGEPPGCLPVCLPALQCWWGRGTERWAPSSSLTPTRSLSWRQSEVRGAAASLCLL